MAWVFGIYLIAFGVVTLVQSMGEHQEREVRAITGIIDLVAGVVVVAWPTITLWALAVVLGICLIARGLLNMGLAVIVTGHRRPELAH